MSIAYSTGTSSIERILRVYFGNLTIGTAVTDALGTSDIRQTIEDAERYINGILSSTVTNLPISPAPNSLQFASDYLTSYMLYNNIYIANKPDEMSAAVKSWKEMSDRMVDSYKAGYLSGDANVSAWTSNTKIFKSRGVKGIGDGLLKDSDDTKNNYRK